MHWTKCESEWREVGDPAIVIAPDDFHKSDRSGGPPYEIAIPDLNADGKLLNERHDLNFVDYLPTAFRFGGFSGYDGIDPVPQELSVLKEGLVSFRDVSTAHNLSPETSFRYLRLARAEFPA